MDATSPALRLFVLHHAGGSHVPYRRWPELLPEQWEVHLLDAPGRGRLGDLPPFDNAVRLADFFLRRMEPDLQSPFAFFGHSMGALVAYEMTLQLAAKGRTLPVWLGLSARGAPRPGVRSASTTSCRTPNSRRIWSCWAAPPTRSSTILACGRCTTRSSGETCAWWRRRPRPETPALPVAMSVFGGSDDTSVPPRRLAGWEQHTERFLGLQVLDGGHFYFQDDPGPLLARIRKDVAEATAPAAAAAS
ncbi:alpha/beta fold hydrolase [Streptomyces albus]|nr:alpha/beta fold hydrolase [Streptomyces albus]